MSSRWLAWSDPQEDPSFQGIEYLELTLLPTPEAPQHARLVIHLQRPSPQPFTAQSIAITGGQRVKLSAADWSLVAQDPAARTLTLDLHRIGDPSDYTVTLLDGAGLPVHPFFATSTFVFVVDCERKDCRPLAETPPKPLKQRPAVDLLTKDYAGFMALLSDWVRVKNPHWADLSPASLERVLVELLAHHGDMLSYYQDRVANEAFIDTASQRYSLRQHATLLGTPLFDGTAAETMLAFTTSVDGYVPEGIEVTTPEGVGDAEVVFHVASRARVIAQHSRLSLAAWPGAANAVVPAGADELLLWGRVKNLLPGQKLAIVQGSLPGVVHFSQIVTIKSFRHDDLPGWVDSPSRPAHANPSAVTIVAFEPPLEGTVRPWDPALPFHIYGNLAPARFGSARTAVLDPLEPVFAADPHNFMIERRPAPAKPILRALRVPEGPVVFQAETTSAGALVSSPAIKVTIANEPWYRVEHFHNSRSYDRHFVATADEDGSLWIEFGDGKNGRAVELLTAPDPAKTLRLDYRVGAPIAGNVGAGILSRFVPGQAELAGLTDLTVVNVLPGTGGRQPETRDAARLRIPASLRSGPPERAVALADYARAAIGVTAGGQRIARAVAKPVGGPFNAVLVLVDPEGQSELSEPLRQAVYDRIDALRMAGREHFVRAPDYVPIEVKLAICVQPGALPHRVRDAVLAALRPGTAARPGFFHPDRLSFGEDLELGQVLAFVQRLPGVRSVKALRFRKLGVASSGPVEERITLGPTEVVRMDGDDDRPEAGKLSVLIVGVDAGVSEKDFVIEETS